jgi:hypothetical protein
MVAELDLLAHPPNEGSATSPRSGSAITGRGDAPALAKDHCGGMTRTLFVSVLAAAALLGACSGGSATPHLATATGSHTTTTAARASETQILQAAAQCIRDHGVSDFPDPVIAADGSVQYDKQLLNSLPDSVTHPIQTACEPQINAAQQYVDPQGQGNQPATPQELAAEKKFAQCVREHGYPNFPDPSPSGGFQSTPGGPALPDKGSPAFQACRSELETVTPAG